MKKTVGILQLRTLTPSNKKSLAQSPINTEHLTLAYETAWDSSFGCYSYFTTKFCFMIFTQVVWSFFPIVTDPLPQMVKKRWFTEKSKLTHSLLLLSSPPMWMLGSLRSTKVKVSVAQSCLTLCNPARLLCPWNSPGKISAVCIHVLLQRISLTQGLNPGLLHCRQILYHLSHQGIPRYTKVITILSWTLQWRPTMGINSSWYEVVVLKRK